MYTESLSLPPYGNDFIDASVNVGRINQAVCINTNMYAPLIDDQSEHPLLLRLPDPITFQSIYQKVQIEFKIEYDIILPFVAATLVSSPNTSTVLALFVNVIPM